MVCAWEASLLDLALEENTVTWVVWDFEPVVFSTEGNPG